MNGRLPPCRVAARARWLLPFAAMVACFVVVLSSPLAVQAQPLQRAAVWLPVPHALRARVAGQVGDLPWEMVSIPPGAVLGERTLANASQACSRFQADVLWWAEVEGERERAGYTLFLVQCQAGRALRRRFVPGAPSVNARSVMMEAVSLALRGALQAIAAGQAEAVFTPEVAAEPPPTEAEPPLEPAPAPESAVEDPPPPPVEALVPPPAEEPMPAQSPDVAFPWLWLSLGASGAWDDRQPPGTLAANLDSRVLLSEGFALSLGLTAALPRQLSLEFAEVSLQQYTGLLGAMWRFLGRADGGPQMWVGVHGGLALLRRITREATPGFVSLDPQKRRHLMVLAAATLTFAWPFWRSEDLAFQLVVESGLLYWPERLVVRAQTEDLPTGARRAGLTPIQARLTLGLGLAL